MTRTYSNITAPFSMNLSQSAGEREMINHRKLSVICTNANEKKKGLLIDRT